MDKLNFPDNNQGDDTIDISKLRPATELDGPMQDSIGDRVSEKPLDVAYGETNKDGSYKIQTPETAAELVPKSPKARLFAIGAAALVAVSAFVGIGIANSTTPKTEPVATASSEPGVNTEVKIPSEAQPFVDAYSSRYEDPLATYYAEAAFEKETGGDSLTIGDEYISTYNYESTVAGEVSPLRFDLLRLPFETEVNVQTSVDQFNSALPTMNRALNLLAKNPTQEQITVIADEFSLYSGYGQEEYADNLITYFNGIVDMYGSNSNYTINPASSETTDSSQATIFDPEMTTVINGNDKDGNVVAFQNSITMSISIDTYDASNELNTSLYTTDSLSFMVSRADEGIDPLHGGFVAIGTR